MTIIVTGGAGFIGSNFVFHMLNKYPDYRIVCIDALTYAGNLSTLKDVMDNPNFRFVKLDICDRKGVYQLFEEEHPDIVVNGIAGSAGLIPSILTLEAGIDLALANKESVVMAGPLIFELANIICYITDFSIIKTRNGNNRKNNQKNNRANI